MEIQRVKYDEYLVRMFTKPARAVYSLRERKVIEGITPNITDSNFHVDYKGRTLILDGSSSPYEIYEQFMNEQYKDFRFKGKTVIDIGGGTADTAIFFILNGAKEVYAFEPDPKRYDAGLWNLKKNKIRNVHYIKKAVTSLDVLEEYYKGKNKVLKCDCEGAEHDIFKNSSPKAIKSYDEMMFEFHQGYLDLEEILERNGFEVDHDFSKYYSADFTGILTAKKDRK
jgi:hypothetical protein